MFLAEEAQRLGLVQRVLARDELLPGAVAYATEIARSCSPAALAAIKAQVDEAETAGRVGSEGVTPLSDFAEGIAALNDHRTPTYPPLSLERPWWDE